MIGVSCILLVFDFFFFLRKRQMAQGKGDFACALKIYELY
jgi:hypothetical protein